MLRWLLPLPLVGLAACQSTPVPIPVQVTSTPSGAACSADRDGIRLGDVAETPGTFTIPAMKGAVSVTCRKAGFVTVTENWTPTYSPDRAYLGPGAIVVIAIRQVGPPLPKSDWLYPSEFHLELLPIGDAGQPLPLSGLRLR